MHNGETEPFLTLADGTEVTVRAGVMFKAGTIAVQVFDSRGDGASAYLIIKEAVMVRDALTALISRKEQQ